MTMKNERFENAMKGLHQSHFKQRLRLAKAEKRAIKLIRLSRIGHTLNSTQLQHIQRYMDRRKKVDDDVAKALEVKN